jgi:hypothetical protein
VSLEVVSGADQLQSSCEPHRTPIIGIRAQC